MKMQGYRVCKMTNYGGYEASAMNLVSLSNYLYKMKKALFC